MSSMIRNVLLILVAFALAACSSGSGQPSNEFAIVMEDYHFSVEAITIKAGESVTMTFINNGTQEHDFVVKEISVSSVSASGDLSTLPPEDQQDALHIAVISGGTATLKFTADTPGTYSFYCSIPGHEEAGMSGELIVTEP